tara:strand:+ start:6024 stop:6800 length:777 start_codon:yes stop_codon:yes gene_type:complete
MIIDSHCHLDYEPMFSNLENVINKAKESNVKFMLTISVTDKKYDVILGIINKFVNVYGTYGIHPHEAKNHNKINKDTILEKVKMSKKIIGIGETGLDFYYNHSDKGEQIKLFEEHIKASIKSNLPLIIHSRNAEDPTYKVLAKYSKKNDLKILMHCFTGTKEFAQKLLELGAYFSASGIITFKKTNDLKETFKLIPLDRILVETDAPYLSPEPLRGNSNEPSNVIHTVKYLSNLKKIKFDDLCNSTTNNFFKLFGKLS